jgi:hypothetical protein
MQTNGPISRTSLRGGKKFQAGTRLDLFQPPVTIEQYWLLVSSPERPDDDVDIASMAWRSLALTAE